jgi:RHS repeat-associated protein
LHSYGTISPFLWKGFGIGHTNTTAAAKITELGLSWNDYGARNADPLLGRWMNVDPLAEMYTPVSGYSLVLNNPISLIDPSGMSVEGDILIVGIGDNQAKEDVRNQVDSKNQQYIKFDDVTGEVKLDFGNLSQKDIDKKF